MALLFCAVDGVKEKQQEFVRKRKRSIFCKLRNNLNVGIMCLTYSFGLYHLLLLCFLQKKINIKSLASGSLIPKWLSLLVRTTRRILRSFPHKMVSLEGSLMEGRRAEKTILLIVAHHSVAK